MRNFIGHGRCFAERSKKRIIPGSCLLSGQAITNYNSDQMSYLWLYLLCDYLLIVKS